MSEKKRGRLSKIGSAVAGAGKAAVKDKAKKVVAKAAKPLTDAVAAKAEEVAQNAVKAVEEKATEMVKNKLKKDAKKKFFGK